MNLKYHEPDERWAIFRCENFQTFLEKYLVQGKFHAKVPDDIKEAYQTIEYLMAHSYYYYPMYDEAISKLLRTIEMALKFRCKECGIDLKLRFKEKKMRKSPSFNDYVIEIEKIEPGKKLRDILNNIRKIRNHFMHPDSNSYSGGIFIYTVFTSVNIINSLFAPEEYFIQIENKVSMYEKSREYFKGKTLVLETQDIRYLVFDFKIIDAVSISNGEKQCLFIECVLPKESQDIDKMAYANPMIIYSENIEFNSNSVSGIDITNNTQFKITVNDHPDNIKMNTEYTEYISQMENTSPYPNSFRRNSEISNAITKFRYRFYHDLIFD